MENIFFYTQVLEKLYHPIIVQDISFNDDIISYCEDNLKIYHKYKFLNSNLNFKEGLYVLSDKTYLHLKKDEKNVTGTYIVDSDNRNKLDFDFHILKKYIANNKD